MISNFFIDHPVFANVIAIVTIVFGLVTLRKLPVEQYPQITPPTVTVATTYPGANAQVVADTVATPIEIQVNGVENMLYMSSTSASDGSYRLTVTFDVGTNLDIAQVLVQNRVAIAQPLLPDEVKRQGITTKKQSTNIIMFVALSSPDGRYDSLYLANYATLHIRDELTRIYGVGDVNVFGAAAYSMRVWMDPPRLKSRGLTTEDVVAAIQEQNVQVAAGQIGQPPVPPEQQFQYTVTTLGRLSDVEQFEDIVVKTEQKGPASPGCETSRGSSSAARPTTSGLPQGPKARRRPRHLSAPRGKRPRGGGSRAGGHEPHAEDLSRGHGILGAPRHHALRARSRSARSTGHFSRRACSSWS